MTLKEDGEKLLAQQIALAAAQKTTAQALAEQQRLAGEIEAQRQRDLEESNLALFDKLGISPKLAEINRDVWRGKGVITVSDPVTKNGVVQKLVSLDCDDLWEIAENRDYLWALKFGRYVNRESRSWQSGDGSQSATVEVDRFGLHEDLVAERILGYRVSQDAPRSLTVSFSSGNDTNRTEIGVAFRFRVNSDESVFGLKVPELSVPTGWKIGNMDYYWPRPLSSGVCISFPQSEFDAGMLTTIIDNLLVQSCATVLSCTDRLIQQENNFAARAREIQSRVGTVRPWTDKKFQRSLGSDDTPWYTSEGAYFEL